MIKDHNFKTQRAAEIILASHGAGRVEPTFKAMLSAQLDTYVFKGKMQDDLSGVVVVGDQKGVDIKGITVTGNLVDLDTESDLYQHHLLVAQARQNGEDVKSKHEVKPFVHVAVNERHTQNANVRENLSAAISQQVKDRFNITDNPRYSSTFMAQVKSKVVI